MLQSQWTLGCGKVRQRRGILVFVLISQHAQHLQLAAVYQKPHTGLQMMFGGGVSVAVQDPSYPVYVDSSVIMGMTEGYQSSGYGSIHYMVCRPETNFFPDLDSVRLTLLAPKLTPVLWC